MSSSNQMLVQTQGSGELRETMGLETHRNAVIGNPADFKNNPVVFNAVQKVHSAWVKSFDDLQRIAADETVMEPVKHENAERVANKLLTVMTDAENAMLGQAEAYLGQGHQIVKDTFRLDQSNMFRDYKMHEKIESLSSREGGPALINELVTSDIDYAKVLMNSKANLLGLAPSVFESMKNAAIRSHAPDAQANFDSCDKLIERTQHYPGVKSKIAPAFYSKLALSRVSTRFHPD